MLRGSASTYCVNGDRLEIGKWQNSTPHRFETSKPIKVKDYRQGRFLEFADGGGGNEDRKAEMRGP